MKNHFFISLVLFLGAGCGRVGDISRAQSQPETPQRAAAGIPCSLSVTGEGDYGYPMALEARPDSQNFGYLFVYRDRPVSLKVSFVGTAPSWEINSEVSTVEILGSTRPSGAFEMSGDKLKILLRANAEHALVWIVNHGSDGSKCVAIVDVNFPSPFSR